MNGLIELLNLGPTVKAKCGCVYLTDSFLWMEVSLYPTPIEMCEKHKAEQNERLAKRVMENLMTNPTRFPNISKIETFKEILDWIIYDWDSPYSLKKDSEGNFYVNKLYIEPNYLTYKTECAELAPGLFEKVQQLHKLLEDHL